MRKLDKIKRWSLLEKLLDHRSKKKKRAKSSSFISLVVCMFVLSSVFMGETAHAIDKYIFFESPDSGVRFKENGVTVSSVERRLKGPAFFIGNPPEAFKGGYQLEARREWTVVEANRIVSSNELANGKFTDFFKANAPNGTFYPRFVPDWRATLPVQYYTTSDELTGEPVNVKKDKIAAETFTSEELAPIQRPTYTFNGWYAGTGKDTKKITTELTPLDVVPDLYDWNGNGFSLNPSKVPLHLYADWIPQPKITINSVDREGNTLNPATTEWVDKSTNWSLPTDKIPAINGKIFVGWQQDNGALQENHTISATIDKDTTISLIYGRDNDNDGVEDVDVTREWQMTDGTPLAQWAKPITELWNVAQPFVKDYITDVPASALTGLDYKGWKLNDGALRSGTPNVPAPPNNKDFKITYVFDWKKYDLLVHYVDTDNQSLPPGTKRLPDALMHGKEYVLEPSLLDDQPEKMAIGWYAGAPDPSMPRNDMSMPLATATSAQEITVVYEPMVNITLPTSMAFFVGDANTKKIKSLNYKIKNNSKYVKIGVKLNTKTDVKISENQTGISLRSDERTDPSTAEEMYLLLTSDLPSFGQAPLLAENTTESGTDFAGILGKEQEMSLRFKGEYYGVLPAATKEPKKIAGHLIWHFSPNP